MNENKLICVLCDIAQKKGLLSFCAGHKVYRKGRSFFKKSLDGDYLVMTQYEYKKWLELQIINK